jgi:hypothetical protein
VPGSLAIPPPPGCCLAWAPSTTLTVSGSQAGRRYRWQVRIRPPAVALESALHVAYPCSLEDREPASLVPAVPSPCPGCLQTHALGPLSPGEEETDPSMSEPARPERGNTGQQLLSQTEKLRPTGERDLPEVTKNQAEKSSVLIASKA